VGGSSSSPAANGNSSNLLAGFSPVKQQPGMQQQQRQHAGLQMQQPDLLGDFSMAAGPQHMMMQQQQLGFGVQVRFLSLHMSWFWLSCTYVIVVL
jgi:hypothetical protein